MTANVILPQVGSRRITRFTAESAIGVTPAGANWNLLRNTGGPGLNNNVETQESQELSGSAALGIRDVTRVSETGVWSYNSELSKDLPFELFLESLLQGQFTADTLVPGAVDQTFSMEDELPDIKQYETLVGARCNALNMTIAVNSPITVTWSGGGSTPGVGATRDIQGSSDISFAATGSIMTVGPGGIPADIGDGSFVRVSGTTNNDGYYEIASVSVNDVVLKGTLTDELNTSALLEFNAQSLLDINTGTDLLKGTNPIMRAGNNIGVTFDGSDMLEFGMRATQLGLQVTNEVSDLREITEDSPFAQAAVNRSVVITMNWHVINLYPLRQLSADAEFAVAFTTSDGTNAYTWTFPKCKYTEAAKGEATNAAPMAGTLSITSLLDSNDVNIQVDRA